MRPHPSVLAFVLVASVTATPGCKGEVVTRMDMDGFDDPKDVALDLEAGVNYELWDDVSYDFNHNSDQGFCIFWVVTVDGNEVAQCRPFAGMDGCAGHSVSTAGHREQDCRIKDCEISVTEAGNHTIGAVLTQRPCVSRAHTMYYGEPTFQRLALQVAKPAW